jgi:hypothetical protein
MSFPRRRESIPSLLFFMISKNFCIFVLICKLSHFFVFVDTRLREYDGEGGVGIIPPSSLRAACGVAIQKY